MIITSSKTPTTYDRHQRSNARVDSVVTSDLKTTRGVTETVYTALIKYDGGEFVGVSTDRNKARKDVLELVQRVKSRE